MIQGRPRGAADAGLFSAILVVESSRGCELERKACEAVKLLLAAPGKPVGADSSCAHIVSRSRTPSALVRVQACAHTARDTRYGHLDPKIVGVNAQHGRERAAMAIQEPAGLVPVPWQEKCFFVRAQSTPYR